VTGDPAEGVDADGYLVTGAPLANVPLAYRPVIDDCVAALTALPELDGLYLYGTVATGQARPPDAGLDLLWTARRRRRGALSRCARRHGVCCWPSRPSSRSRTGPGRPIGPRVPRGWH